MTTPNGIKQYQWNELLSEAQKVLIKFLAGHMVDPQASRIKVASNVISAFVRHETAQSVADTTQVIVLGQIADNKAQFAEYIRLSMPHRYAPLPLQEAQSKQEDKN